MSTQDQSQTSGGEDLGDLDIDFTYEILPDDFLQYDLSFKIIVIGDSGVGKSCLTNRATTNLFEDTYNATVGFEFLSFNVKIDEKVIKLQIWDTCGQELYRSLITNFYRNSSLAIIVYAINSKDSFEDIEMWLRELRTHSNPDAKVFLIGNKLDLENERKITKEQGETFAKNNKLNLFIEASAKTGFNSKKIFIKAAKMLYDEHLKYKDVENKVEIDGDSDIIAKKKDNMKLDENKKKDKALPKKLRIMTQAGKELRRVGEGSYLSLIARTPVSFPIKGRKRINKSFDCGNKPDSGIFYENKIEECMKDNNRLFGVERKLA